MIEKTVTLTKKEVEEILIQVERAYRRGFQQGHHSQLVISEKGPPSEDDVFNYRYETSLTKDFGAPETQGEKPHAVFGSVFERFAAEIHQESARSMLYKLQDLLGDD